VFCRTGILRDALTSPILVFMRLVSWVELVACWLAWLYPFIFRAPHFQKRASITASTPTMIGLILEVLGIFAAFAFRYPPDHPPGIARMGASLILGVVAAALSWSSVRHLGRQFRVQAGLYEDHQLVRTGPYAIVRHPIYSSLLAMLLCTLLLLTPWQWAPVSLALFLAGTEIRVRTEDGLLASRFAAAFRDYRQKVPAYVPFLR
jgi:protein-S-isoprenylcysteine O-methyltransferase Ste14